jgi:hypothetical protein
MDVGVVDQGELSQEQQVVEERDQTSKHHGTQAGNHANQNGQQGKAEQAQRLTLLQFHFSS